MSKPQEPDRASDPDALDSLLAVYMLDLRAHYEAEMRLLTEAQRQIERYRTGGAEARVQARAALMQHLAPRDGEHDHSRWADRSGESGAPVRRRGRHVR